MVISTLLKPVSYTHLDVYKRQLLNMVLGTRPLRRLSRLPNNLSSKRYNVLGNWGNVKNVGADRARSVNNNKIIKHPFCRTFWRHSRTFIWGPLWWHGQEMDVPVTWWRIVGVLARLSKEDQTGLSPKDSPWSLKQLSWLMKWLSHSVLHKNQ